MGIWLIVVKALDFILLVSQSCVFLVTKHFYERKMFGCATIHKDSYYNTAYNNTHLMKLLNKIGMLFSATWKF